MNKLRIPQILGVYLLAVMLLLSACAVAPPMETPDAAAGSQQQLYGSEDRETPDGGADALPDTPQPDNAAPDASIGSEDHGADAQDPRGEAAGRLPTYGGYYYDLSNVVLYLEAYGELPPNYITKKDARALGWEGGSVETYKEGAAIGGDFFGNYEGLLPHDGGQRYTECDIDTNGYPSRGSRRLVFSDDGRYFYTSDHYESFSEYRVSAANEVIPCE